MHIVTLTLLHKQRGWIQFESEMYANYAWGYAKSHPSLLTLWTVHFVTRGLLMT